MTSSRPMPRDAPITTMIKDIARSIENDKLNQVQKSCGDGGRYLILSGSQLNPHCCVSSQLPFNCSRLIGRERQEKVQNTEVCTPLS